MPQQGKTGRATLPPPQLNPPQPENAQGAAIPLLPDFSPPSNLKPVNKNINIGICPSRVQEGKPPFFVNWTDSEGNNKYEFCAIRSQCETISKRLHYENEQEEKPIITFVQRNIKKNIYFGKYHELLDKAIDNFKEARTVKVIGNTVFVHKDSFGYFTSLIPSDKCRLFVITTLV